MEAFFLRTGPACSFGTPALPVRVSALVTLPASACRHAWRPAATRAGWRPAARAWPRSCAPRRCVTRAWIGLAQGQQSLAQELAHHVNNHVRLIPPQRNAHE